MTLHALLFDVDGTLADTERDGHRPAFNQAFADAGLDWHWDVALYGKLLAVTGGKERMKHYIDHFRPDYRKPDNFDELVAELHKAKTRIYSARAAQGGIPMRPGSSACWSRRMQPACAWRSPPPRRRKTSPYCWNIAWAPAPRTGSK